MKNKGQNSDNSSSIVHESVQALLRQIFESPSIIKVGYDLGLDKKCIQDLLNSPVNFCRIVDMKVCQKSITELVNESKSAGESARRNRISKKRQDKGEEKGEEKEEMMDVDSGIEQFGDKKTGYSLRKRKV